MLERLIQIIDEPKRCPYAVRVDFLLGKDIQLPLEGPVCLLAKDDAVVELQLSPDKPLGDLQHLKCYRATIQGFQIYHEAELNGLRLSTALLWTAISRKFTLKLEYHALFPYVIYDRTIQFGGVSSRAYGSTFWPGDTNVFAKLMREVFVSREVVDRQLLLSMELFSAARIEVTERARFLSLVSALEPLAQPLDYPQSIKEVINDFRAQLNKVVIPDMPEIDFQKIRNSLNGRLGQLERESIRQALLRTVRELLGDENDVRVIDSAYSLRSAMLHEGTNDPYLDRESSKIENIIRKIYAARIGCPLQV